MLVENLISRKDARELLPIGIRWVEKYDVLVGVVSRGGLGGLFVSLLKLLPRRIMVSPWCERLKRMGIMNGSSPASLESLL